MLIRPIVVHLLLLVLHSTIQQEYKWVLIMYEVLLEVSEIQENWKKKQKTILMGLSHTFTMLESSSNMKRKLLTWKLELWNRISDMSVA